MQGMEINPFQSSNVDPLAEPDDPIIEKAREQLRGPSFGLFWFGATVGSVLVLLCSLGLGIAIAILTTGAFIPPTQSRAQFANQLIPTAGMLIQGIALAFVAWGARHMRRLTSWRWALASAILAMIPQPFVVITFPLGMWALIVLYRKDVQAGFARKTELA
jgi:hypothetical protein